MSGNFSYLEAWSVEIVLLPGWWPLEASSVRGIGAWELRGADFGAVQGPGATGFGSRLAEGLFVSVLGMRSSLSVLGMGNS